VLVKYVCGKFPTQNFKTRHFRPGGYEQRIGSNIEWRFGAEFAAP